MAENTYFSNEKITVTNKQVVVKGKSIELSNIRYATMQPKPSIWSALFGGVIVGITIFLTGFIQEWFHLGFIIFLIDGVIAAIVISLITPRIEQKWPPNYILKVVDTSQKRTVLNVPEGREYALNVVNIINQAVEAEKNR